MDALRTPVGFCVGKSVLCGPVAFYVLRTGQLGYETRRVRTLDFVYKKRFFYKILLGIEWVS